MPKKRPAPRHPPKPEAKLKAAMERTFSPVLNALAKAVASGNQLEVDRLRAQLTDKVERDRFDNMVRVAAVETADSARRQLARIIGLDVNDFDPDMDSEIEQFVSNLHDVSIGAVADLIDRAEDLISENDEITQEAASDGLVGAMGSLLAGVGMAFTYSFAQFNKATFSEAGIDEYVWTSLHDDRVRSEHEYLDGIRVQWDDPPLGSDESSSGEDCHAGDDFNCRCTPSPVLTEDAASDDVAEQDTENVDQAEAA